MGGIKKHVTQGHTSTPQSKDRESIIVAKKTAEDSWDKWQRDWSLTSLTEPQGAAYFLIASSRWLINSLN